MASKQPPTFGQHPYDPALEVPPSQWQPIQDLTHLQNFDGVIEAGNSANENVAIQAQSMFPEQTKQYADWARYNPTMDPRAWQPLAAARVDPNSAAGAAVGVASVDAAVKNGTHDTSVQSNQATKPTGVWSSASSPFGTNPVDAGQGNMAEVQGQTDTPLLNFMGSVGKAVGDQLGQDVSALGVGVRGVQYLLASGWDAMQGTARTAAGQSQKQMEIAKKYGLSSEEANIAFPVTPALQSIAGKDLNQQPSNPSEDTGGGFLGGLIAGATHKGAAQVGGNDTNPANIPADRMALIKKAQDEYQSTAPSAADIASTIAEQTPIGQIAKNPALLTQDTGILAGSEKIGQATEAASLKAYDPRTLDEIARGVKPFGWTPGRGVAHVMYSPDDQMFHTLSGLIDFSTNLAFDPANKIPLGALGKVVHGGVDLVDMMAGGGTRLPGAIRRGMKTTGSNVVVNTTGLPTAEITTAEKKAAEAYLGSGYKIVNQGLRGDISTMSKVATARTTALDSLATKHALGEDTVLYRAVSNPDIVPKKGRVFTDKGFASSTTDQAVAHTIADSGKADTVLRIHAPAGTAGIDVAKTLGKDAGKGGEFILPRDSKFKVTGTNDVIDETGKVTKYVNVILQNPKKATALGAASGALAAARPTAAGAAVADALTAAGHVVSQVTEPVIEHLPDGTVVNHSAGLVDGPTAQIVMGQNAWDLLNSGRGKSLVNDLVAEDSASRIIARSNGKIDANLATILADAKTPEEVRAAIGTRLGFDLNDPASLRNFGSKAPAIFKDVSLRDNGVLNYLRKAPHARPFDLEDVDNTVTQVSRFARGARMKWDAIQPHLDNIIRADGDGVKTYNAIYGNHIMQPDGTTKYVPGLLDAVADHMVDQLGISRSLAKKVTTAFQGGLDETQRNFVNTGLPGTMGASVDGNLGSALLDSELLTKAAVLPDYRTVRELTGALGRALHAFPKAEEFNVEAAKIINAATSAWKSAVLVRPAYVFREVGEMAVASSLAGYDGALTHPGGFLGMVLATIAQKEMGTSFGRLAKAMTTGEMPERHFASLAQSAARGGVGTKLAVGVRKGAYQAVGAPAALADYLHLTNGMRILFPSLDPTWARVNGEGLFQNMNDYLKTGDATNLEKMYYGFSAISGNFNIDERGMGRSAAKAIGIANQTIQQRPQYTEGLIAKLSALASDGDIRNLANPGIDFRTAVKDFQMSGRRDRKMLAGARNFVGKSDEEYMRGLDDVLHRLTGGDQTLLEAVARGTFDDVPISKSNKALADHIGTLLDNPDTARALPDAMRYLKPGYAKSAAVHDAVSRFFEFTGESSDLLQRGPIFREAYAREAARLAPKMDPTEHAAMVADLQKYGDRALVERVSNIAPSGTLHRYEVDKMAMKFARDEQARIFYDAHERQNYAVALRTLMPFAQATFNTIRRWGELTMKNPQLMYRTLKPLNYAQQPGAASIYGALGSLYGSEAQSALYDPTSYGWDTPDSRHNSVDGFSYTDGYGDRKFTYPLIGAMGEWAGIPQAAMNESSVAGLNVAGTTINPGFGPGVTFAASLFGQNLINRDDAAGAVTRFLFPYGLPTGSIPEKLAFSAAPSWTAKIIRSSDDTGSVANLAAKLQPVLKAQGNYDLTSVAGQRQLVTDSTELASRLYWWNAIIGTLTPSTVNTKTLIATNPAGPELGPTTPVGGYTPTDGGKIVDSILKADPMDRRNDAKRFIIMDKMRQEWDKYTANTGSVEAYRAGVLNFVHDYGTTALFSVIPTTQGADGTSPTQATNDVWHFHTNQPETYSKFRDVIGMFFAAGSALIPGDTSATGYAPPLYAAQKAEGERLQMTPADHVKAAMNEWGWMIYNPKKNEIETNGSLTAQQKAAANSQLADNIKELTDGAWTPQGQDPGKTARLMQQLHTAVADPVVQTLNSAPYLKDYMDYRDQIISEMRHAGLTSSLSSQAAQPYALKLIARAKDLIRADPTGAFNNAWNRLLIKEYGSTP